MGKALQSLGDSRDVKAALSSALDALAAESNVISLAQLRQADSQTTAAIIRAFSDNAVFRELSALYTSSIVGRDEEDGRKLQAGIQIAIDKGVLEAQPPVEPITRIDVMGKSADEVVEEVVGKLGKPSAGNAGKLIVFQGLSGTGKGTTTAKLQERMPNTVCWSNGNLFRCITLLAVTHLEKAGIEFSAAALTPELLSDLMKCMSFGEFKGKFDIKVSAPKLGIELLVSEHATTTLKGKKVGKNIPTVAGLTQGEVVTLANKALQSLCSRGTNVLLEGRSQTVNYIRSPHRFELVLKDPQVIGMRRTAQVLMGKALQSLGDSRDVKAALNTALEWLQQERSGEIISSLLSKLAIKDKELKRLHAELSLFRSELVI